MKRSGTFSYIVFFAAGLWGLTAACSASVGITQQEVLPPPVRQAPKDTPEKQRADTWEIEYEVSGGIAGIERRLKLSGNGKIIAIDQKNKRSIEQQASPEQLTNIRNILVKTDFSRMPETRSKFTSRCADCFQHRLSVIVEGQGHKVLFSDVSLRGSEYAPLIGLLASLLDQALLKRDLER